MYSLQNPGVLFLSLCTLYIQATFEADTMSGNEKTRRFYDILLRSCENNPNTNHCLLLTVKYVTFHWLTPNNYMTRMMFNDGSKRTDKMKLEKLYSSALKYCNKPLKLVLNAYLSIYKTTMNITKEGFT